MSNISQKLSKLYEASNLNGFHKALLAHPSVSDLLSPFDGQLPWHPLLFEAATLQQLTRHPGDALRLVAQLFKLYDRIPRWAQNLTTCKDILLKQKIGDYTEDLQSLAEFHSSTSNYNPIASVALLWPHLAGPWKQSHPGCDQLHKLRQWDPTSQHPSTQPCPLDADTLTLLKRWKNRKVLSEWGITTKQLRNTKETIDPWKQTTITQRKYTFIVGPNSIQGTTTPNTLLRITPNHAFLLTYGGPNKVHTELRELANRFNIKCYIYDLYALPEIVESYKGQPIPLTIVPHFALPHLQLESCQQLLDLLPATDPQTPGAIANLAKLVKTLELTHVHQQELLRLDNPKELLQVIKTLLRLGANYTTEPATLTQLL